MPNYSMRCVLLDLELTRLTRQALLRSFANSMQGRTWHDVLSKDLDAIDDISVTMSTYSKSLAGNFVFPEQVERFYEGFLSRSRAMTSTRADLEEEILQLSRQIY